ncbi:Lon protease C-terminal proteolytic domain-containing protein [Rhodocollybia butyracea]|uniref:endopeptidase La n=1 Tax=Rhodocollybia butyracea TaxID=206335 RepID=A0A9P5PT45_9AGAR|nr:Lon protease C-terminal proteolytic domain-containing protein [Rhodocollybia butyracea]
MNRLGQRFASASPPTSAFAAQSSSGYPRRKFAASFLNNSTKSSRWMMSLAGPSQRTFSSSPSLMIRRSPKSGSGIIGPRWINSSGSGSGKDGKGIGKSEEKEKEDADADTEEVKASSQEEGSSEGSESESDSVPPASSSSSGNKSLTKPTVPTNYPTVLALPIARRPLFPGFYKAVVIKNPAVVRAVREMMSRGQPYLGAFLLKEEEGKEGDGEAPDRDVISSLDEVHDVGVFAQITSVFSANPNPTASSAEGSEETEEHLTAVLYPHRRIRITELVKSGSAPQATEAHVEVVEDSQTVTPPPTPSDDVNAPGPLSHTTSFLQSYPISIVNTTHYPTLPYVKSSQHIRALTAEIVTVFKDIAQLNPLFRDQITNFSINQVASNVFDEPDRLADFAAAVSSGTAGELQEVLEEADVANRLGKALVVLKKELINAQLQNKISKDVDTKIAKRQREYYLMEQLKGIKKELGLESDGKDKLLQKFKDRAMQLDMPAAVRKVFDEELNKLASLEPSASEANVTRTYLEWITQLPWGVYTPTKYSVEAARQVLEEDHYGLKELKERVLEFVAVGKLRGSLQSVPKPASNSGDKEEDVPAPPPDRLPTPEGKIILLHGPPGVGKTSVGKSLARAVGREFFRFSVGGLGDVAEIKGHRRTYVGALPGKIVQALKRVGTSNPLVLIDEIDKLGRGHNGDPSSALLEMLDPEQNKEFLDHYLDLPIDLSRVLFVCTANNLSTIPAPLLDRMEVLEVSGYVSEEKRVIAEKYLAPQAKASAGLQDADVVLERSAIDSLIKWYARESGVRNLKKMVEKIYRKTALKIVQDLGEEQLPEPPLPADAVAAAVTPASEPTTEPVAPLTPPDPEHDQKTHPTTTETRAPLVILPLYIMYEGPGRLVKGVSTGLGYLGNGSGAVMPIETLTTPGKGSLILTGKLGEVIRESAQIALSWVKAHAYDLRITDSPDEQWLSNRDVHIHMPEGSIGKEGPSAGTAILSALVSLGSGVGVKGDVAMTGEISLSGHVLPVGGLKEKILAAHRAGIKTILAPAANRADIEENVPDSVKEGIKLVYVEDVREVLKEVFSGEEGEEDVVSKWADSVKVKEKDGFPASSGN